VTRWPDMVDEILGGDLAIVLAVPRSKLAYKIIAGAGTRRGMAEARRLGFAVGRSTPTVRSSSPPGGRA
jgi:hypothetical protein